VSDVNFQRDQAIDVLWKLLDAAFTDAQLAEVCLNCFPEAYAAFPHAANKHSKILYLIHTAARRGEIDALVDYVERSAPRQYNRFARQLVPLLAYLQMPAEEVSEALPGVGLTQIELVVTESGDRGPGPDSHVYAWLRVDDEDFDILGEDVLPVTWDEAGPQPLIFNLCPRRTGHQDVRVELYHESTYLGSITESINVRHDGERTGRARIKKTITLHPDLAPPDLLIRFYKADVRDGEPIYHYRVSSPLPELRLSLEHMGDIPLKDPTSVIGPVLEELDSWAKLDPPPQAGELNARLARIGMNLYTQLVPDRLDELYWRLPRSCKSVQIISDVPVIPWEMLRPKSQRGDRDPALARQFALTRWPPDADAGAPSVSLKRVRVLVGKPVIPLKGAEPEAAELETLLGSSAARVEPPQSIWEDLVRGGFDTLHIISHGYAESADANQSYVELGGGPPLRASDLSGYDWSARRPLLFVNACNVGREGVGLTGLGGWASTALTHAHAGAFIGAMWQASDGTAGLFSKAFYEELLRGATLGEASRGARLAIASEPNPTWLCYAVYAHPNARVT